MTERLAVDRDGGEPPGLDGLWNVERSPLPRGGRGRARRHDEGLTSPDALVVVDVIDLFEHVDADRLLASYRERLDGLRRALDKARAERIPVIYVNDHHGRWDGDAPALVAAACAGPGADVVVPLAPEPGEAFLFKSRYSIFDHTLLELLLRELEVDRLLLMGGTTEGCVVQSGIDARELGLKVTIVEGACASIDGELEQLALRYAREVAGMRTVPELAAVKLRTLSR
jgi:nicotinamidase-related amidase